MEAAIAGLVQRFEQGALSRRELIQGLSMLALGVAAVPAAAQQPTGLKATGLNHLGLLCSDVNRSTAFYVNALGMTLVSEDKPKGIARLGVKGTLISLRQAAPAGHGGSLRHLGRRLQRGSDEADARAARVHCEPRRGLRVPREGSGRRQRAAGVARAMARRDDDEDSLRA